MEIWVLRVAIGTVLIAIGIQDLRLRGVSWYLFPVLGVLLRFENPEMAFADVLLNVAFIVLIFLSLSLWFCLRLGRLVNIFDQHIGTGDLLFLACLTVYFNPTAFFLFYLFSLLVITAGTGVYLFFQGSMPKQKEGFTVPLAGLQGLLLLAVMLLEWATGFEQQNIDILSYLL